MTSCFETQYVVIDQCVINIYMAAISDFDPLEKFNGWAVNISNKFWRDQRTLGNQFVQNKITPVTLYINLEFSDFLTRCKSTTNVQL